jgi:hypothetical protein
MPTFLVVTQLRNYRRATAFRWHKPWRGWPYEARIARTTRHGRAVVAVPERDCREPTRPRYQREKRLLPSGMTQW